MIVSLGFVQEAPRIQCDMKFLCCSYPCVTCTSIGNAREIANLTRIISLVCHQCFIVDEQSFFNLSLKKTHHHSY